MTKATKVRDSNARAKRNDEVPTPPGGRGAGKRPSASDVKAHYDHLLMRDNPAPFATAESNPPVVKPPVGKIVGAIAVAVALAALFFCLVAAISAFAYARDDGQWGDQPANVRQWFQKLMQPDNPAQSCCGEADAFESDDYNIEGDHYVAIITDGHGEIQNGTRIPVPNFKMKWDQGNPTGHGIIFLSRSTTVGNPPNPGYVYVLAADGQARILYCYVAPGGV